MTDQEAAAATTTQSGAPPRGAPGPKWVQTRRGGRQTERVEGKAIKIKVNVKTTTTPEKEQTTLRVYCYGKKDGEKWEEKEKGFTQEVRAWIGKQGCEARWVGKAAADGTRGKVDVLVGVGAAEAEILRRASGDGEMFAEPRERAGRPVWLATEHVGEVAAMGDATRGAYLIRNGRGLGLVPRDPKDEEAVRAEVKRWDLGARRPTKKYDLTGVPKDISPQQVLDLAQAHEWEGLTLVRAIPKAGSQVLVVTSPNPPPFARMEIEGTDRCIQINHTGPPPKSTGDALPEQRVDVTETTGAKYTRKEFISYYGKKRGFNMWRRGRPQPNADEQPQAQPQQQQKPQQQQRQERQQELEKENMELRNRLQGLEAEREKQRELEKENQELKGRLQRLEAEVAAMKQEHKRSSTSPEPVPVTPPRQKKKRCRSATTSLSPTNPTNNNTKKKKETKAACKQRSQSHSPQQPPKHTHAWSGTSKCGTPWGCVVCGVRHKDGRRAWCTVLHCKAEVCPTCKKETMH